MAYFGTVAAHNILVHGGRDGDAGVLIAGNSGVQFKSVNLCPREAVTSLKRFKKHNCVFPSRQRFTPRACVLGTLLRSANGPSLTL